MDPLMPEGVNNLVDVKRQSVEVHLTCPLCSDLLTEATTICLCLHTFCRKCIYQKLEDDDTKCCPLCNTYLGSFPEDKLRPDNALQAMKMKVLPMRKSSELDNKNARSTLLKNKERSLSSLAERANPTISKPRKLMASVSSQKPNMSNKVKNKVRVENNGKGVIKNLGSNTENGGPHKFFPTPRKQRTSLNKDSRVAKNVFESQTHQARMKDDGLEWDKLSILAETADMEDATIAAKRAGSNMAGNRAEDSKMALLGPPELNLKDNNPLPMKTRKSLKSSARELKSGQSNANVDIECRNVRAETTKPSFGRAIELSDTKEQFVGASSANRSPDNSLRRLYPVWFVLLACEDRGKNPQIPESYIRIKDRNMPASCINKYLVRKFNLRHESEVEVMCRGQIAPPNATLNDLVDIWLSSQTSIVASSRDVHDFLVVLSYRRK